MQLIAQFHGNSVEILIFTDLCIFDQNVHVVKIFTTLWDTWSVVRCLSLNLSSMYRSNRDVFPTHPSPSNTTLKLCVPLAAVDIVTIYIISKTLKRWTQANLICISYEKYDINYLQTPNIYYFTSRFATIALKRTRWSI